MSGAFAAGFLDDHLHLLACAAARRSIDVSSASSIEAVLDRVRLAVASVDRSPSFGSPSFGSPSFGSPSTGSASAEHSSVSQWLRVWGYDDALLAERRHLTVAELDSATAGLPIVLHHVTGHVAVVNTAAGRALGLSGGDVLVERQDLLARVPRPDRAETVEAVAGVMSDLAAAGIGACTDATHTNDLSALELISDAIAFLKMPDRLSPDIPVPDTPVPDTPVPGVPVPGVPAPTVTAMVGADRIDSLGGLTVGMTVLGGAASGEAASRAGVRVGHAKVMPPHHDDGTVGELVSEAHARGFPVAVHVMDIDTLETTLDALEANLLPDSPIGPDRIEHCALALPSQLDRIARLGLSVVTQPSFVVRRAPKYLEQLSGVEREWLWPLASLIRRGIHVTFSSDAPTAVADPAEWIEAATRRQINPAERIDRDTAHRLCLCR